MPRGGIEETQWISFLEVVQGVQLCHVPDRLGWSLDSSDSFSVASVRHALDNGLVPSGDMGTRWNNWVPIKINILIWRIQLFSIPTRERFSVRGVMVPSIMCPICMVAVETIDHIFAGCRELRDVWGRVAIWWGVSLPSQISVLSLINWSEDVNLRRGQRKAFDAVIITSFWCL